MTFPTTTLLDDFIRGDMGPHPSRNWADTAFDAGGSDGLKVVSNAAKTNTLGVNNESFWKNTLWGPDTEVFCDLTAKNANAGSYFYFGFRMGQPANPTARSGYVALFGFPSDGNCTVFRLDGASTPQVGSSIPVTINAGDSYGISMIGSTITAWRKPAGGSWTSQGSVTDSTYQARGHISLGALDVTTHSYILNNFSGGTVNQIVFPTVGLLDNFNRGNEIALVAPWKLMNSQAPYSSFSLTGSAVSPVTGSYVGNYYTPYIFPAASEIYMTCLKLPKDNGQHPDFGLDLRMQNPDTNFISSYEVALHGSGTSGEAMLTIFRVTNNVATSITGNVTVVADDGVKVGMRVSGSLLETYLNNGRFWYKVTDVTDTTYPSGGYAGFSGFNILGGLFDDLGAGSFPGTVNYPMQAAVLGT